MFEQLPKSFNNWFVANQYLATLDNPAPSNVEFAIKAVINSENINTYIDDLLRVPPNTDFTVTCVDCRGQTGQSYIVNTWNSTVCVRQVVQVNGFAFFEQPEPDTVAQLEDKCAGYMRALMNPQDCVMIPKSVYTDFLRQQDDYIKNHCF